MTSNTNPNTTFNETNIPETITREASGFGLKGVELVKFCNQLGRLPSREEMAVCGALWSEHCSYKSSKVHLRRFHTEEPWVWQGPGENAGIVGLTGEWGIAFKMESHNHPSYIEPYQGAATGVGGILRDVFCMGAWPIANMNCLRYGEGDWNARLLKHTVRGIADYGNSVGVPTVSGDTSFHPGYSKNILVNAFTAGLIHKDAVFKGVLTEGEAKIGVNPVTSSSPSPSASMTSSMPSSINAATFPIGTNVTPALAATLFPEGENLLVYFGQATGRDGVHGATMSSSEFSEAGESLKPTVQVGDPFAERRLLEATLALIKENLVVGLQDMGAAGLTSSSVEMAGRSGCGVAINLNDVPQRAANMQAFEILLSESQERMLCAIAPDRLDAVRARLASWDVEIAVVGRVNRTGLFVCTFDETIVTAIPVDALVEDIPKYEWPVQTREAYLAANATLRNASTVPVVTSDAVQAAAKTHARVPLGIAATDSSAAAALRTESTGSFLERHAETLVTVLRHPAFASRFPLTSHYDGSVQGNTIAGCGNLQDAAAAIVRLPLEAQDEPQGRVGAAFAAGCEERWVEIHPLHGAIHSALKVARRIVAVGGTPLALTDCLNFGSPTNPSVMRQLSDAIDGITLVSRELKIPVVSGNVSLNNQTEGRPIPPTPMLGIVGRVDDVAGARLSRLPLGSPFLQDGLTLAWLTHPALQARLSLEVGLVHWLLAGENANVPEPDLKAEQMLWQGLARLGNGQTLPLCVPVGHGGALLGALRLAFAGEATLDFAPEFLSSPMALTCAEGQAGFLLGFPRAQLSSLQANAKVEGLGLSPVATLRPIDVPNHARAGQPALPASLSVEARLRRAWHEGLVPFFQQ